MINVESVNSRIGQLTCYGLRKEVINKPGCRLSWSNGSRRWIIMGTAKPEDGEITLDANELLVEGAREDIVKIIGQLEELPLYKFSTEARFGPLR